jgi:hypothetical protein
MPSSSVAVDWSSLAPDLVSCVGDILLASGDIDYYMILRAVCRNWRGATDDPRSLDLRFRPRGWAMLGSLDQKDSRRLFLNVHTGRFLWKDMPMLCHYTCVGTDDANGLLILKAARGSEMWILNPFTGYLVRLPRPWGKLDETLMVAAHGQRTKVVYTFWDSCRVACNGDEPDIFTAPPNFDSSKTMVAFQSCGYVIDEEGTVTVMKEEVHSRLREEHHRMLHPYERRRVIRVWPAPLSTYLVDNAGELLLVRPGTLSSKGDRTIQVLRVDLDGNGLHSITSIGNSAIFLLDHRCLLVDARNLPGIEANCIYYVGGGAEMTRGIWMYRLEDGSREKFFSSLYQSSPQHPSGHRRSDVAYARLPPDRPLSLQQVLLDYPKYAPRYGSGIPKWQY